MNPAKITTVINYVLSGILWLLGILTLLFNILGLWTHWHLAGFGFIIYCPVPLISQIISLLVSWGAGNRKFLFVNLISLAISVCFALFTVFVSASWFW